MGSQESSSEIKVQITGLSACYKPQNISTFLKPGRQPPVIVRPEIDPDFLQLNFVPLDEGPQNYGGNVQLRTSEVKRLNLTVGDVVSLKIAKT